MVTTSLESINCPFCNTDKAVVWAVENGFNALKCNNCSFLYVSPRPKIDTIQQSVEEGIHSYLERPRSKKTRRIRSKISMYRSIFKSLLADVWSNNKTIKWLDVGSGYGEVVQAVSLLSAKGSMIEGIEPMRHKAEVAAGFGLNIKQCYLSDVKGVKYDFISLINVFSHLDSIDSFLNDCNRLIDNNGEIILETGNIADLNSPKEVPGELDLPDHLMFAGEKHIEGFLSRAGFKVVDKVYYRRDTVLICMKNIVKKILGRPVNIFIPYTSKYRAIIFRAKKIPQ